MKSVCSIHEQAYDVGERCPYCEEPEAEPTGIFAFLPAPITFTAPPGGWELKLVPGALPGKMIWDIWSRPGKS